MMDAVTEVLLDRSHQADRLTQMVVVSLLAHAVLLTRGDAVAPRCGRRRRTSIRRT